MTETDANICWVLYTLNLVSVSVSMLGSGSVNEPQWVIQVDQFKLPFRLRLRFPLQFSIHFSLIHVPMLSPSIAMYVNENQLVQTVMS